MSIISFLISVESELPEIQYKQIEEIAKKGDADSELEMGLHYSKGSSNPDEKEAVAWFEKAAKHGNIQAKYFYGLSLLEGHGVLQNFKEGITWLEQAARQGNAKAQYTMGEVNHYGIGVAQNDLQAYLWFTLAAAQNEGSAVAMRDKSASKLSLEQITLMQEEAKKIASSK